MIETAEESYGEEEYDDFDANANQDGKVSLANILARSNSRVSNASSHKSNRRITSIRCLSEYRSTVCLKPAAKTGPLQKYSPALFVRWQNRHIEIEDGILKYFKEVDRGKYECCGTLNFDLYQCFIKHHQKKKRQFMLTMKGNEREFLFKAKNEEEAIEWIQTISMHIKESKGRLEKALAPKTSEFWRQEQISENQFLAKADTFDILLFKCNTGGGKIIRTYTRSEFDHAAMVLKFNSEPDDVFFIEATGN